MRCPRSLPFKHSQEGVKPRLTVASMRSITVEIPAAGYNANALSRSSTSFTLRPFSTRGTVSYALNTKVCFQKKINEKDLGLGIVVVVVTVIFCLSHAIVVETIPWNTGLIPPEIPS